jgi:hypothetical protein
VVADAADPAVVRDDAAAVAVDRSEDEFFGGLIDKRLLPGFEGYPSFVLDARAVLGE